MKKFKLILIILLAGIAILIGMRSITPDPLREYFIDVAVDSGVDVPHTATILDTISVKGRTINIYTHFGAAWGDVDNDSCIDLYVADTNGPNRLFMNDCEGGFTDEAFNAGVAAMESSTGVAFGDINNDRCIDLFVSTFNEQNILYKNNCDGTFTDITDAAGVGGDSRLVSTGIAWVDYNNDGLLDIYVTNFMDAEKMQRLDEMFTPLAQQGSEDVSEQGEIKTSLLAGMGAHAMKNYLYKNNGNETFTEVAESAGIAGPERHVSYVVTFLNDIKEETGLSYGSTWFDYNNDGCIDALITSDTGVSPLYKNNCDGTFSNVSQEVNIQDFYWGMGSDAADINNDGYLDIIVTNGPTDKLYINQNGTSFEEQGARMGIVAEPDIINQPGMTLLPDFQDAIGWGTLFFDSDNDTDKDLFIANGAFFIDGGDGSKNKFYINTDGSLVEQITLNDAINKRSVGLAAADYDNNGLTDLYITNTNGPNNLLQNIQSEYNNWIRIKLQGTQSNSLGIGATVTIRAGDTVWTDQMIAGGSYLSQSEYVIHQGLGTIDTIDTIEVMWPSGIQSELSNVEINSTVTITEE